LPRAFGKIHPKYKTPWFSTIVTAIIVAVPSLFMESTLMTDLTSIGTLFAFVLVAGGVLMLPRQTGERNVSQGKFQLPYINGRPIVPILYAIFVFAFRERIKGAFQNVGKENLQEMLFIVFMLVATVLTILSISKKLSLIPILGVLFCSYLLIEIPAISWLWFFAWMAIGLTIYFMYGYRKSKLATKQAGPH